MFDFLKKILSGHPKQFKDSEREILTERLSRFCYDEELVNILYTPEAKIYLLNTYTKNFNHLLEVISNNNPNRELYSVNGYAYFNNTRMVLLRGFKHILNILMSENKICPMVFYDINEIVDTLEYLIQFKENSHA